MRVRESKSETAPHEQERDIAREILDSWFGSPEPQQQNNRKHRPRWWLAAVGGALVLGLMFWKLHIWSPATCTQPEACVLCGINRGIPAPHTWSAPTCNAPSRCLICQQEQGEALGHWLLASTDGTETCRRCGIRRNLEQTKIARLQADYNRTLVLYSDGTAAAIGYNVEGQCRVGQWDQLVDIASGTYHTVGLRADGTVVATGDNSMEQCNTGHWRDIIAVAAGSDHTVALHATGTVAATGDNSVGQCQVGDWTDVVQIVAGSNFTAGLQRDGTVLYAGDVYGLTNNPASWSGIKELSAYGNILAGITVTGKAVCTEEYEFSAVSTWKNLSTIVTGYHCVATIRTDGTVRISSSSITQKEVDGWKNVVQLSLGANHILALLEDGTMVAAGDNAYGQCEVSHWENVIAIATDSRRSLALCQDGTILVTGFQWYDENHIELLPGVPAE